MIAVTCPWCAEDALLALVRLLDEADFTCGACGTIVALVEEPRDVLDLAA